jgi:hypothetical protein
MEPLLMTLLQQHPHVVFVDQSFVEHRFAEWVAERFKEIDFQGRCPWSYRNVEARSGRSVDGSPSIGLSSAGKYLGVLLLDRKLPVPGALQRGDRVVVHGFGGRDETGTVYETREQGWHVGPDEIRVRFDGTNAGVYTVKREQVSRLEELEQAAAEQAAADEQTYQHEIRLGPER